MNDKEGQAEPVKKLTFWEILGSTFAAALGVQSFSNRKRDFTHGNILHFIVSGVLFTAVLVAVLMGIVTWVLA